MPTCLGVEEKGSEKAVGIRSRPFSLVARMILTIGPELFIIAFYLDEIFEVISN